MKKSADLIHNKTLKNIIPYNLEQEVENDEDQVNINYTTLNRISTLNSLSCNEKPVICNTSNSSMRRIQNEKMNDFPEEKTENFSERNNIIKYTKKRSINKKKIEKGSIKRKNGNKKIVYVRKRNNDIKDKDKKENIPNNIIDKELSINNDSEIKEREIINEIKDSVICYICLMKIEKPRICPNCHKIACEKCLKNWFIDRGNNNCGYCRAVLTFDNMISIPIINNVANLIDKISSKNKIKKIGAQFTKIKIGKNTIHDINNDIIKEENIEFNEDDIISNSINFDKFKRINNSKENIYLNKKQTQISHSTHGPYINMFGNNNKGLPINEIEEYCSKHPDQPLFYYCIDCNQAYCRTCFVFFGEEKDKHNEHSIIEYEKYKSMNIPQIIKNSSNLDDKYEEIEAYIKRCEALKNCYEFERMLVREQIKLLMDNFNTTINDNIAKLDNIINKYKNYLNQINKCKKDIQEFYINQKYEPELVEKINDINKIKYYNSKEIDNYSDLSKKITFKAFQTKLKKYEIKQNNYHYKVPLEGSKYQLAIAQKENELQIYIYWSEDKDTNEDKDKEKNNSLLPFVFMRKKNKNWECFKLDEFLKYKGNNYYIKRFSTNNFCNPNSYFKIKGILYENYIE